MARKKIVKRIDLNMSDPELVAFALMKKAMEVIRYNSKHQKRDLLEYFINKESEMTTTQVAYTVLKEREDAED